MTDPKTTAVNPPAQGMIGHNNPPEETDPLLVIQADGDDTFAEVANWLDGSPVTTEAQMNVIDGLRAAVAEIEARAVAAKETEFRPHKAAADAVSARWKGFLDDLTRQKKGLTAVVDGFKRQLAAEKAEATRKAQAAAWEATRKAQEAAQAAEAGNIEAVRAAAALAAQAEASQAAANVAERDTVRGMRTYTVKTIVDGRAAAAWIWKNDRAAMDDFIARYVDRATGPIDGVEVRTEKRAV